MKKNLFRRIWDARSAYAFIAPAYIPFLIFTLYPLVQGLRLSLYKAGVNRAKWEFIGLGNFVWLFTKDRAFFPYAIRNTFLFVILVVPAALIISLFISVIIFPTGRRTQSFFRLSFYMPVVAGGVILAMVWIWIFNRDFGLLNYLLDILGILDLFGLEKIGWLAQPNTALLSLAVVVLSWSLGQPIILFLAALGGIPQELYDAAKIDGANAWQEFKSITLPLLRPTMLFVLVTVTIAVFQVFVVVWLMTLGGPANATQTIVFRMWENAFTFFKFGRAAAMGVVLLIIVGTVAFVQFKFFGEEEEF